MLEKTVLETIEKRALLEKGAHVVLGVSGGPDSVCLLSVLSELSSSWNLKLHVVHIHHGLRGEEADADQRYTQDLCRRFSVPCRVFSYDVKKLAKEQGLTTEEMGRLLRYEAFETVRQELLSEFGPICSRIAVAQNQNDQAETILMRILRGTGVDGLAGIEYIREGTIIRPLLDVSRKKIEEYCVRKELFPRTDSTNLAPDYTRNKIRLDLIPYLQREYNENIIEGLCRLAKSAAEDKAFIYEAVDGVAKSILSQEVETAVIERTPYCELSVAVGKRLLLKTLKGLGLQQDVIALQLERADLMIRKGATGDRMDFPHGFELLISYDSARLGTKKEHLKELQGENEREEFCYLLNPAGITDIPELNARLALKIVSLADLENFSPDDPYRITLSASAELWQTPIYLRSRQPGDYMKPLGMQGMKKIQDLFVDEKIPAEKRAQIPLLCTGQEVIWIVGRKISENYKVKKDTEKVVILEFILPA